MINLLHCEFRTKETGTKSGQVKWLIDLRTFRAALTRHGNVGGRIVMGDQSSLDVTWLRWFDIRLFPSGPPLVVGSRYAVR